MHARAQRGEDFYVPQANGVPAERDNNGEYNRLRGRKFKPLALSGPDKSRELIKSGMDVFKKQNHQSTEPE
jgi:hypothetical protein